MWGRGFQQRSVEELVKMEVQPGPPAEEAVRHRPARVDRDRERRRQAHIGSVDDDGLGRHLLIALIVIVVVIALIVGAFARSEEPVAAPVVRDEVHMGAPTDRTTRVQAPVWFTVSTPTTDGVEP